MSSSSRPAQFNRCSGEACSELQMVPNETAVRPLMKKMHFMCPLASQEMLNWTTLSALIVTAPPPRTCLLYQE
ncbi:hypothetical protein TNCV_1147271 [Trichonephila clavipes]|nr:hypothetical protein TNCV_1147271 [Trichonephila clavipes]